MEHLRHIIGFSSHVSAINQLQPQHLHHQQWIQHQLKQLRILETNLPNLQVFTTIIPLKLQQYITANDNDYSPEFGITDLHHMLYYAPFIGICPPTETNMIKLRYVSGHTEYNTFPTSTLRSFIANNPTICLLSNTRITISIRHTYYYQKMSDKRGVSQFIRTTSKEVHDVCS